MLVLQVAAALSHAVSGIHCFLPVSMLTPSAHPLGPQELSTALWLHFNSAPFPKYSDSKMDRSLTPLNEDDHPTRLHAQ